MLNIIVLASSEPNGPILTSDIDEVIWGTIAFLIVAALLWWKALPAAKTMARTRSERIDKELTDAAEARRVAEANLTELQTRIANVDAECSRISAEGQETAASLKSQLMAKADADATDARLRAQADAESAQGQVARGLEVEIGRLAVGAAEAVVTNSLDDAAQADLIDRYIERVGTTS